MPDFTRDQSETGVVMPKYNPYGAEFLKKNLKPLGISDPATLVKGKTESQLYDLAAANVVDRFRKAQAAAAVPPATPQIPTQPGTQPGSSPSSPSAPRKVTAKPKKKAKKASRRSRTPVRRVTAAPKRSKKSKRAARKRSTRKITAKPAPKPTTTTTRDLSRYL